MNIFKDSTVTIDNVFYDFSGVCASTDNAMNIIKVECLKTGADLTSEYQKKYAKPKTKVSKSVFDMLVSVNGFDNTSRMFEIE